MRVIKSENCLCTCCMEKHEVKTVLIQEISTFKNVKVRHDSSYYYCELAEELYLDEQQMRENDVNLKDAYRKEEGLLTSAEIVGVRAKYDISQSDLCVLLGWGRKTITRYEGHQVQDKAHDTILRKIAHDPEWFLSLLTAAQKYLSAEAFQKYLKAATNLYEKDQDLYLRKAIEASYVRFQDNALYHGNTGLSLDKVVDVVRYFAASKNVMNLYKTKLMRLLWYADAIAYKRRGYAITGLVYQMMPAGIVPVGDKAIIDLKDIPCVEIEVGEADTYYFSLENETNFRSLSEEEKQILDGVISQFGKMTKNQMDLFTYKNLSWITAKPQDVISFEYTRDMQI